MIVRRDGLRSLVAGFTGEWFFALFLFYLPQYHHHSLCRLANDVKKITAAVKRLFSSRRVARHIDGAGEHAHEIAVGQYAFLTPCGREIWIPSGSNSKVFQENWWGTVVLDIAMLASSAKHLDPARR